MNRLSEIISDDFLLVEIKSIHQCSSTLLLNCKIFCLQDIALSSASLCYICIHAYVSLCVNDRVSIEEYQLICICRICFPLLNTGISIKPQ